MRLIYLCAGLITFVLGCHLLTPPPGLPAPAPYTNPVVTPVAADPTVIRAKDGRFYLYATNDDWGDGRGLRILPIFSSPDLVHWTYEGTVFDHLPAWKDAGSLWAPDISYHGGRYHLYYSYSTWGDPNPCIGRATAERPKGPWSDLGRAVFCSKDIGVANSIDPFVWKENGRRALIWGSFNGIYAVPLSPDGTAPEGDKVRLADERFEGAFVHRRNGYYYLFVSAGSCCEGASSTYRVYVGRSENLLGPYLDAQGRDLRFGGGTLVLRGNDTWAGPGHNSVVTDDAGTDWLVYHAIPKANPHVPSGANRRPALLDPLTWNDGWPSVQDGVPSDTLQQGPIIRMDPD